MKHKVLIGFMGSGKTSVSRILAESLGLGLLDTDEEIERLQGRTVSDIFAEDGEPAFRQMERELLMRLSLEKKPLVIATGGGLAAQPENRQLLKKLGDVIYLQVRPETVLSRLADDSSRPLLQGGGREEKVKTLLAIRQPAYEAAATCCVCTDGKSPRQIAEEIMERTKK